MKQKPIFTAHMKTKYFLPLTLMVLSLVRLGATTVVPPTFEQLVQQAEFIFQGTVTDVRSIWEGEGAQRHIETYVTFQVADAIKGNAVGTTYTIQMLGGTVGDDTLVITDAPKFRVGDHDILFVENNGQQFVPLVGIMYGRFRVQHDDQTGSDIVLNNEGEPLRDPTQLGRDENAATAADAGAAISSEQFKSAIRNQLNAVANQSGR
jgi:hypothetical protein